MFGFGWMELLLVLVIVLIVFGAGKLPQLGEGLGKAIKGFKQSVHEPDPQQLMETQSGAMPAVPASSVVAGTPTVTPVQQEAGKVQG